MKNDQYGKSKQDLDYAELQLLYVRNRILQLRLQMGASSSRMSLYLGHSRSYIRGIDTEG